VTAARLLISIALVVSDLRESSAQTILMDVGADTSGPRLIKALSLDASALSNRVMVTFNEPVSASSASIATNYGVTAVGLTNQVRVTAAVRSGLEILLALSENLYRTNTYVLSVTGVSDLRSNNIAPGSQVAVSFTYSDHIFGMSQPWTYYDSTPGCPPLPSNWSQPSYVEDERWGRPSPGIFAKFSSMVPPVPCVGTYPELSQLSVGCVTHYFRTHFDLPAGLVPSGSLSLQHFLDDGAVFYLNGLEMARFNMPTGAVSSTTFAVSNAPPACAITLAPITNLLAADNVLAIELHQASADVQNVAFGLQLALRRDIGPTLPLPEAPTLSISRSGAELILSWSGERFRLEIADDTTGPWREAQPFMSNPWTARATNGQAFYRLQWTDP
jgi:hypothetical protein